jgi:hypothetical protein
VERLSGVKNWSRRLVREGEREPIGRSEGDSGGEVKLGRCVGEVGGERGGVLGEEEDSLGGGDCGCGDMVGNYM